MVHAANTRFWFTGLMLFLFVSVFMVFGVVADAPPALLNHQFYGNVYWDANLSVAPTQVDARIMGASYTSAIRDVNCNGVLCSATYGKATDNILRVQGSNGLSVSFFLGDRQVTQVPYESSKVQNLDLNIATTPISCTPNPDCTEWTGCLNDKQNRSCFDLNKCGPAVGWNKTEESVCDANRDGSRSGSRSSSTSTNTATSSAVDCINPWDCSLWSMCIGGEQRRLCSVKVGCSAQAEGVAKPSESQVCSSGSRTSPSSGDTSSTLPALSNTAEETCFDGVLNQDERGIDCGGACKPCPEKKVVPPVAAESDNTMLYVGIGLLAVLVIGLVVFLIVHKKKVAAMSGGSGAGESVLTPSIVSQLDAAYAKGEASGMSRSDVTAKLTEKGWDTETLEEYLMSK